MHRLSVRTIVAFILLLFVAFAAQAGPKDWKEIKVSATAYNSVPWQTTAKNPATAAWGDKLKPGMHAIAVSRDLIKRGLKYGSRVKIEGLPGIYVVLDKMNRRWSKKIDIFMGKDIDAARNWGIKRNIEISWSHPKEG